MYMSRREVVLGKEISRTNPEKITSEIVPNNTLFDAYVILD